jgi:hypothetical protein
MAARSFRGSPVKALSAQAADLGARDLGELPAAA